MLFCCCEHMLILVRAFGVDVVVVEGVDCFNSATITAIVATTTIVISGNRFFSAWKEKMGYGRSVIGRQSETNPTCHIPIVATTTIVIISGNRFFREWKESEVCNPK